MSSGGAEYFSPGRESGGKVDHDHAPEGRNEVLTHTLKRGTTQTRPFVTKFIDPSPQTTHD